MKYCKACKVRAKDTDAVCSRCGGELSILGERAPGDAGGADVGPALTLQGQIQALEQTQQRNVLRIRLLAAASVGVLLLLLFVLYQVYAYRVLSYAVLSDVQIEQDPRSPHMIRFSFVVESPGKVAFDRRSGTSWVEKLDVLSKRGKTQLAWVWPSDASTGIDLKVVYRGGWTRTSVDRQFDVVEKPNALDIVFLVDTTSSMTDFINDLKRECIDFASSVRRGGYDCSLGLVGFGDVDADEEPFAVYDPTSEIQQFQTRVGRLKVTGGGDIPESGIEALQKALELSVRPDSQVCFVHVTDAPCHNQEQLPQIASVLRNRGIVTYVVSTRDNANLYQPLCVNGGRFFAFEEARFDEILKLVAKSLVSEIRYQ